MSLFSSDSITYKGFDITKDHNTGLWHIKQGGRYGVSHGTAPSKDEAKRYVDRVTK